MARTLPGSHPGGGTLLRSARLCPVYQSGQDQNCFNSARSGARRAKRKGKLALLAFTIILPNSQGICSRSFLKKSGLPRGSFGNWKGGTAVRFADKTGVVRQMNAVSVLRRPRLCPSSRSRAGQWNCAQSITKNDRLVENQTLKNAHLYLRTTCAITSRLRRYPACTRNAQNEHGNNHSSNLQVHRRERDSAPDVLGLL